ncbi:MAG: trypsin-like peptidase domain-containing protein [Thermoguttaceae bacterium]|nr:trypsin-like peptidase domain-containing protein [Thermoguttaceae bacterium]MDW8077394.1 trypsin-like peptidase domain-containing protein [Thermoguttaceae bacterium]
MVCAATAEEIDSVRALQRAWHAVVSIRGEKRLEGAVIAARGESARRIAGMGTGVIIDPRGYIVTNHHVVDGVQEIQVSLANGKEYIARRVARDAETDIAIIKIDPDEPLQPIAWGTSSGLLPGEPVVALGNAYGYQHTATRGIISAVHRAVQVTDAQFYDDLIQTDASINPGNSGGPLLNRQGEMIGLNVAVRAGAQGIGFAIPADKVAAVVNQLLVSIYSERIWTGLVLEPEPTGRSDGARVEKVAEGSPAAEAGFRAGDLIVEVGDSPISRPMDFHRSILERSPGELVRIAALRDGERHSFELKLRSAEESRGKPSDWYWELLGLRLEPLSQAEFRQRFGSRYRGGLLVTAVRVGGPAAQQGIQPGDVLVGMHIWETVALSNVDYVIRRVAADGVNPVKVYIVRGTETYYGYLSLPETIRTALQK